MPRFIIPLVSITLCLLIGLAGCATGNATGWTVPKRTLDEQLALLTDYVEIRLPDSANGPVPAVILFHGCGGLRDLQSTYADAALEAGYAAVLVDSNRARGLGRFESMTQVCLALRLWGQERAADIHAAIALAEAHPGIDASQLVLVGWSHGGWTLLEALGASGRAQPTRALREQPSGLNQNVRGVFLLYPYCGFPLGTSGADLDPSIPVHTILAERDLIAPHRDCANLLDQAEGSGVPVDYEIWADITHAFDDADQPADPRMEYNAGAAREAHARMIEVLDALFGDTTNR